MVDRTHSKDLIFIDGHVKRIRKWETARGSRKKHSLSPESHTAYLSLLATSSCPVCQELFLSSDVQVGRQARDKERSNDIDCCISKSLPPFRKRRRMLGVCVGGGWKKEIAHAYLKVA